MADRPLRLPPSSDSKPSKKSTLKERARNALITGTAGGYLGGMLVEGKARVKIPALTRKLLKLGRRKTIGIHGARTGALAGALIGARNQGKRSETVDAVATGGDWKFQKPLPTIAIHRQPSPTSFSAFIEDMTFSALSKDVQTEVLRFVDAKKGTPVVHYGMGVKELLAKADAVNLASARKALGTLRASRARDEVLGKIKDGSKYILLMNDRIVDGHHFLAKAERGNVTSSLNVLDLTPARLSTGKVTEFAGKPFAGFNPKRHARTGGLNDSFRKSYNREHGSNLKRPVTTAPGKLKPGSKAANRRASFCARMGGMKGATSKGGELTPKGAALKRWNCEARQRLTQLAEGDPRRNRTRDLRDKIGLAKDVAGLGVTVGAGVGAHKLYKGGKQVLRKVGPQIGSAAKAWHKAALKTGKTLDTVKDAVAPAAGVNRGVASVGRKIVQSARRVAAFLHSDPRPVLAFSEERKAKWNAALLGAAAPVAAGGLVLGTRGGRNALRGLLSKVDKGDPRRLRRVALNQKRKDASIRRNADKAVNAAREKFRAEALPKAPKEPGLKDAVKTVRQRAKRKIVNAVANIGANPAEVKMSNAECGMRNFAEPRDRLSKARDAALLTAGAAGTGAVVYGAHKLRGLKSSPTIRKGKAIAENVRNATSITADAGRIYNHLKDPIVRPKRVIAGVRRGWKQGMKEGMSQPAPAWKKGVVKIGKKLRLLESASPSLRFSKSPHLQSFAIGGLIGTGIGTLVGSQIGERFKYKTRNALKKKLIPKLGKTWGRRVARTGAFIPENAGAVAGGVVGSIAGGGIRRTEMRSAECGMTNFGGNEQLVDIDSSSFVRPLDQLTGRKKGYSRTNVKDYHTWRRKLEGGKLNPEKAAELKAKMKSIRDNPENAGVGQVLRNAYREGAKVSRWTGRGKSLVKDAGAHLRGEAREKDQWGRTKKREWEKGWFNNAKGAALSGGALVGGALLLRAKPKLRAKIDRAKRQATRTVNHPTPGKSMNLLPQMDKKWKGKELKNFKPWTGGQKRGAMTKPWPKTAQGVPEGSGKAKAKAKVAATQDLFAKQAADLEAKAAQAASAKKVKSVPPAAAAPKRPRQKKFAVLGGRLIEFDDPLDVGWDLRDARGRSARVFAPGAGSRDRRPKKWHEKVENERKLWGAAALTGTLGGAAATRKIMQKTVKTAVQAERVKIREALQKVRKLRAEKKPTNIRSFKPEMRPGTAA